MVKYICLKTIWLDFFKPYDCVQTKGYYEIVVAWNYIIGKEQQQQIQKNTTNKTNKQKTDPLGLGWLNMGWYTIKPINSFEGNFIKIFS